MYDLSADRELFQESLRMEELTDGQVLDCVAHRKQRIHKAPKRAKHRALVFDLKVS